jgi:hypothetical protein
MTNKFQELDDSVMKLFEDGLTPPQVWFRTLDAAMHLPVREDMIPDISELLRSAADMFDAIARRMATEEESLH